MTRYAIRTTVLVTAVLLIPLLGACEQAKEAVNKGGSTPCSEFMAQDQSKQRITVRKYLEQDTKVTPTADPDTVDASIAAITLMCQAQRNPDTPIRDADLTGILVPKR
ncbi:hypothetical protein [Nocardia aurantiaca]|uniref:Acid stress chaperone HdeA n=1 Tax=Nocardia aurantiaca TaxID=2675850 RepID=A0A6I3L360_9NOCA|nr:hypothetical protein [Nocardia aurantiaca]MTE15718.1 hypothetical protein [Nocardia aurantiaca]